MITFILSMFVMGVGFALLYPAFHIWAEGSRAEMEYLEKVIEEDLLFYDPVFRRVCAGRGNYQAVISADDILVYRGKTLVLNGGVVRGSIFDRSHYLNLKRKLENYIEYKKEEYYA